MWENLKKSVVDTLYFYPLARVALCPCTCLSVRHKPILNKKTKYKITKTTPHNSPGTLVFVHAGGIGKNLRFSTGREVSGSDALPPKICIHPPW